MLKKILITLGALVVIIGAIGIVYVTMIKTLIDSGKDFQLPPEYISSAEVTEESWKQTLNAVGSLVAVQGVTVSSEVSGKITKIHFESGETVEAGQLLLELDMSTEKAQLAAAEADLQLAKVNLERVRTLRKSNTVAQSELDSSEASYLSTVAQLENIEAVIQKKRIVAPFSGRLGIRQIDQGQFMNNGQAIVSLQTLDPIYVDFSFPQKWISKVDSGMVCEVTIDSFPDTIFSGKITAINPEVNVSTRTVNIRATLDNADSKLLPGMFAEVSVILPEEKASKVVPATSILYNSYGNSVFVIREKDGKKIVEQEFVQLGESRGDYIEIKNGPEIGSSIAETGVFKLRNGVSVAINNDVAPSPQLNPNPSDS